MSVHAKCSLDKAEGTIIRSEDTKTGSFAHLEMVVQMKTGILKVKLEK